MRDKSFKKIVFFLLSQHTHTQIYTQFKVYPEKRRMTSNRDLILSLGLRRRRQNLTHTRAV